MIKTTGPEQGGPPRESAANPEHTEGTEQASNSTNAAVPQPPLSPPVLRSATKNGFPPAAGPEPVEGGEIELLSRSEKRRRLAQIVRVNPLDCFDDSGAFDLARAQRILPPGAVQSLTVHETTRFHPPKQNGCEGGTDRQGNMIHSPKQSICEGRTVQRRITLRLVDKVRAMRLDDALEEKQGKTVESDALKRIAHLEKALTEADDRELQFSKDSEEKDRQLAALQRARHLAETTTAAAVGPESSDPEPVEGPVEGVEDLAERAEAQRRQTEEIAIQSKLREIEHHKNTSGHGGFSSWYPKWPQEPEAQRAYALRLIKAEAEAAERQKIASAQRAAELAARPTRPPRRFHSSSFAAQGKPMFYASG